MRPKPGLLDSLPAHPVEYADLIVNNAIAGLTVIRVITLSHRRTGPNSISVELSESSVQTAKLLFDFRYANYTYDGGTLRSTLCDGSWKEQELQTKYSTLSLRSATRAECVGSGPNQDQAMLAVST